MARTSFTLRCGDPVLFGVRAQCRSSWGGGRREELIAGKAGGTGRGAGNSEGEVWAAARVAFKGEGQRWTI